MKKTFLFVSTGICVLSICPSKTLAQENPEGYAFSYYNSCHYRQTDHEPRYFTSDEPVAGKTIYYIFDRETDRCYPAESDGAYYKDNELTIYVIKDWENYFYKYFYEAIGYLVKPLFIDRDFRTIAFPYSDENGYDCTDFYVRTGSPIDPLPKENQDDEIYYILERMPRFHNGDLNTFRDWVQNNIRENGKQGRVIVSFIVEKDGKLSGFEAVKSPDPDLTDEVFRVLGKSPEWKPGYMQGEAKRLKHTLMIGFGPQE